MGTTLFLLYFEKRITANIMMMMMMMMMIGGGYNGHTTANNSISPLRLLHMRGTQGYRTY
jgi:hypothetical protein